MAAAASETIEDEAKLISWSSNSTKLLISLRKETENLFIKGKVRKNVAWQKLADKFSEKSSVKVTGEQCSNKWKKLEEKFKKINEHNNKTGNERKEMEFEDELAEFYGSDPKILPQFTVSTTANESACLDEGDFSACEEDENSTPNKPTPSKKRKKRNSKSSASEMIQFLREFREDKKKEEQEKTDLLKTMHEEKMGIMDRFLNILSKK